MKNQNGFTLLETIICIFLTLVVLTSTMQLVSAQALSIDTLKNSITGENSVRYPLTVLEKQIKSSDIIYVASGIVYIRDMETKDYFNTYSLGGKMLYKNKHSGNLNSIGLGARSQFASDIISFSMEPVGEDGILVKIESELHGRTYYREKLIKARCPVYSLD